MIVCVLQTDFKYDLGPVNLTDGTPPTPSVHIDRDLKRHNCVFALSG